MKSIDPFSQWALWGEIALEAGILPLHMNEIVRSNINTSSPYLVRPEVFAKVLAGSVKRENLLLQFDHSLNTVEQSGLMVEAVLVGGSFTDATQSAPRDLDCVIFYSNENGVNSANHLLLEDNFRTRGIDSRLIPVDGPPILLIKAAIFFSNLYSSKYKDLSARNGSILIDCSKRPLNFRLRRTPLAQE